MLENEKVRFFKLGIILRVVGIWKMKTLDMSNFCWCGIEGIISMGVAENVLDSSKRFSNQAKLYRLSRPRIELGNQDSAASQLLSAWMAGGRKIIIIICTLQIDHN